MRSRRRLYVPAVLEIPLTSCVYALCAALLSASLFVPALIVIWGARRFLLDALVSHAPPSAGGVAMTASLLDPYMISIGDGTGIGGDAVLSAHVFSNGRLFLAPIRIGKDCQIGAHALLCPGVTLGDGATVGIMAYVRKGRHIHPGARVVSVGGLAAREALRLERGGLRRFRTGAG